MVISAADMERKVKSILRGIAVCGLAVSAALGPDQAAAQEPKFKNNFGELSSDPELILELFCSQSHVYDEKLKWKGPHIDISASFVQLEEESVFFAVDDGEKTVLPFHLVSKRAGGRGGSPVKQTNILTSHGFVGGFVPEARSESGEPVYDYIWLKPDRGVRVSLYQKQLLETSAEDWFQPLGKLLDRTEFQALTEQDCPGASTDATGLEAS